MQARTEGLPSLYDTQGRERRTTTCCAQSQEAFTRALDATLASSSLEDDLAQVVALLCDRKRRVWFVGGRFSQLVATYLCLQLRMLRLGLRDRRARRRSARVLDSLEISRRDVLCLFDYRRYQQDTIAVGKVAAEHGAVVVVFTDPWLSPAVEYAPARADLARRLGVAVRLAARARSRSPS